MATRSVLFLAVSSALVAGAAFAEIERQHAPHVHGVTTGNLSMDDGDLRLELEIPGMNLIGFEHAPRNDEQQAALDGALAFLRAAEWLQTDPRGGCELASINAHTHGFGSDGHYHGDAGHDHGGRNNDEELHWSWGAHQSGTMHRENPAHSHDDDQDHGHDHDQDHGHDHDHGQDHDHDHAHDHHHHDHDHSEFHVVIGLECANPDRLAWVDLRLFSDFPGNERMDIDVLTARVATQARLTPGNERISLR